MTKTLNRTPQPIGPLKPGDEDTFVARATELLSSALNYEAALAAVANLAVPLIADWCSVHVLKGRELRHVAIAHENPERAGWAREIGNRYPPDPQAATGIYNVLRTGEAEIYADITDDMLAAAATDADHLNILRSVGLDHVVIVPLSARGRILGTITFVSSKSSRRFDPQAVARALAVGRLAGTAVDNALLYEAAQEAEHRMALVADASAELLREPNVKVVLPRILDLAAKVLAADAHAVWRKDPSTGRWEVATSRGLSAAYIETAMRQISETSAEAVEFDGPVVAQDVETTPWLAGHRSAHLAEGTRSLLVAPLKSPRGLIGTIVFYYKLKREFTKGEMRAVKSVANLAGSAFLTSDLYESQREARRQGELELEERRSAEARLSREATAQILANRALKESEARYRTIVETAQEGIWMVDAEYRTTFVNERMAEMLGYQSKEMIGRSVLEFMDEPESHAFEVRRADRRRGRRGQYDGHYRHKEGRDVCVIVTASPMLDADGQFLGALALMTDITDRKRLEEERMRLAAIVETSQDAIVATDLSGTVTSWNAAAERIYGWNADEIVGKSKALVIPPDLPDELSSTLSRILAGERIEHYETRRVRKDGTIIHVSVTVSPLIDPSGKIVGASTIARDITERRRIELELHQRQTEVEALNERLRQAMRETHHRVKNNLQVIAAMVDLQIIDRLAEDSIPLDEFTRLSTHIRTLAAVHDVLTRNVREEEQDQVLSIQSVFGGLIPLLEQASGDRPVRARVTEMDLSGKQATSLALVTNELVSNAVKHGNGVITVDVRSIEESIVLIVRDEGPGFPPDFDPETFANTGLQLVRAMAETDLGGTIHFANDSDGAVVTLTVPIRRAIPILHSSNGSAAKAANLDGGIDNEEKS